MSHSKIRIGISLRITNAENYDEKQDSLSQDWPNFFKKLNFLPVLIPNTVNDLRFFLEEMEIDGIVLSGGDNIGDFPKRDKTENEMIEFGIEKKIPIFGVCRGMQILNSYFGGSIELNAGSSHVRKSHDVKLTSPQFSTLLQSEKIQVNSYHKNVIHEDKIGKNLSSFAISENDHTVEGFFHKQLPIMGVMWHPERDNLDYNKKIFKNFFLDK